MYAIMVQLVHSFYSLCTVSTACAQKNMQQDIQWDVLPIHTPPVAYSILPIFSGHVCACHVFIFVPFVPG